jgi:hypothetical protein
VPADDCLLSPIAMLRLNNQPTGAIKEALSKLIWADARLLPSLGVVAISVRPIPERRRAAIRMLISIPPLQLRAATY